MYYYRPRRSTRSQTPLSAGDTMRDNEQSSTTDAQESSCAPEEAPDEQDGSISDMQTLLLFLLLVDRLAIAQGTHTPDMEGTIVESEPLVARAEDTRPRPTRRRTFPLLLLAFCILCSIAVVVLYTVPLLTSSASVTIIPTESTITTTTTVTTTAGRPNAAQQQIQGRLLSSLTLTQAHSPHNRNGPPGRESGTRQHHLLQWVAYRANDRSGNTAYSSRRSTSSDRPGCCHPGSNPHNPSA